MNKNEEEGKEEECTVLPSISIPSSTHKLFLDRFGETAYKTWMLDTEVIEDTEVIKLVVSFPFKKTALEKYTDTLKILTKKKMKVEVKQ